LAAALATFAAALPAGAEAKRCHSGQFDRGGTCTSYKSARSQVLAITRSVLGAKAGRAAIVRIDVGNRTLVNAGMGSSTEGVRANPRMKFRPGSMTIPLMTALALQLQEKRRLDLDDPLARWFPQYPNANRVTLRMLASVRSGYPDYIQGNPAFQAAQLGDPFHHWSDDDLLRAAFALPPVCEPGACFHYAHTNFILLGRVLEKVTGQSVTTLLKKRFLRPLKMTQTKITKLPAIPAPALHAYSVERGVYEDSTGWSPSWGLGNGLIMTTTARDMIRQIKAIGRGRLFSGSSMRQFTAPLSRGAPGAPPPAVTYGLGILTGNGWMIQNPFFNGYAGVLAYLPAQKLSVVIENTYGSRASPSKHISMAIFGALTKYLSPAHSMP
jgi:CubicO group peptidase (beta-lactamase class C family)